MERLGDLQDDAAAVEVAQRSEVRLGAIAQRLDDHVVVALRQAGQSPARLGGGHLRQLAIDHVRRSGLFLRLELDRSRVDAVTEPGGVRAVVEDVAQVAAALRARDLRSDHEVAAVGVLLDRGGRGRGVEARPAAVSVELGVRDEQLGAAAGAPVQPGRSRVPVLARERPLGALLPQNLVLLRGPLPPPLRFRLPDFLAHFAPLASLNPHPDPLRGGEGTWSGGPPVYDRDACRTVIRRATSTGETIPTSRPWS